MNRVLWMYGAVLAFLLGGMASAQTVESAASIVTGLNLDTLAPKLLEFIKAVIPAVAPGFILIVGTLGAFYFVWNKVRSLF